MPLFFLHYLDGDAKTLGAAIVEERDPMLARRKADNLGLGQPGPCTVDRLDPASVPAELIGRRLSRGDIARLIAGPKKPPAPSVRRKPPGERQMA
jgi:hypothetical protein